MKLELTQRLRQEQILAPQMILSMDILLLSNMELENRIQDEFMANPALEMIEREPEPSEPSPPCAPGATPDKAEMARQEAEIFSHLEAFQSLPSIGGYEPRTKHRDSSESDDKSEAIANVAGKPDGLREHLIQQLHLGGLEPHIVDIAENIVNNLDSRGYLLFPPEEIRESLGDGVSPDHFQQALAAVRSLDPPGIGAENLQECLIIQLERDHQEYGLEVEIIRKHLEDLRQNRIPKIARDLGCTVDKIKEALEIITSLNPLPGGAFDHEPTIHVRPEVTIEKNEGRFEVKVDEECLPRLQISDSCRNLLKEAKGNPEILAFVRKKIESAHWLIQAVRQRQRTLYDIAKAITEFQVDFMEHGPTAIKALKMQTIADLVGVHISTISRAIKCKYMQTPWGTFEMRHFFTGGVERTDGGGIESRRNIYRDIGELIGAEDKRRPLSDTKITVLLRDRGLDIARRTVTKYREQEGIPPSRLRKEF